MSGLLLVLAALGQDVTAPVFLDVRVEPVYIDTTHSDQIVTVYAELSDDLSGIRGPSGVFVGFHSLSGTYKGTNMSDTDMVSGDNMHGWYTRKLLFPQYSELGIWRLDLLHSTDRVGNDRYWRDEQVPFDVYVINGPLPIPGPSTIVLLAVCLALAAVRWRVQGRQT